MKIAFASTLFYLGCGFIVASYIIRRYGARGPGDAIACFVIVPVLWPLILLFELTD